MYCVYPLSTYTITGTRFLTLMHDGHFSVATADKAEREILSGY